MARPKGARDTGYDAKRSALLRKLSLRLARLDDTHPSLRQLALAAEVTVPTLRHYFGSRDQLVAAVFAEQHKLGQPFMQQSVAPKGELAASIREFLTGLVRVMTTGPELGALFAVGLIEGLLNRTLGPSCLANLIDPVVDALEARLHMHQARGEIVAGDMRNAALMLLSPILVACQHQYQMFGRASRPLDLQALAEEMAGAFVRAYGAPRIATA